MKILKYIVIAAFFYSSVFANEEIYLNFEKASLSNVVQYIADKKNINLIPHKDLESLEVTLTTHTPFSLEKAWNILLTLLETNGYSIINVNGLHRVVAKDKKTKQPLPSYIGTSIEDLPNSDELIRYIYIFKNINIEKVRPIITQLLEANSIEYNANLNMCLITEKSNNIKSVIRIISELDSGGLRESIQIIKLKEADAENVAKIFTEGIFGNSSEPAKKNIRIFMPKARKDPHYFSSDTKIIPDARNNSLILLGTKDNLNKIRNFISKHIDVPLVAPQSRLHIKELKYTLASDIKSILDHILKPPVKDVKFKYFEDVKVAAEEATDANNTNATGKIGAISSGNRLVIACNTEDWKRIESFIDQLDKPQPQVSLEILFVDASIQDSKELATQLRNKSGMLGKHVNIQSQHILASPESFTTNLKTNLASSAIDTSASPGGAYFTLGADTDIHTVLKAVLNKNNSQIITQPYLVVNNHKTTMLEVSEDRVVDGDVSGNSTSPVRSKDHVKATTKVQITPGINLDGIISLKIDIEIDEFIQQLASSADRTNRHVSTLSTMMDGEILVIGGLTESKIEETHNKTPIFSKIPIVGALFKGRKKVLTKSDLYIFIRPTLIKPKFEGAPGDYTQLKLDYAKILIGRHQDSVKTNDPIQKWFFKSSQSSKTLANAADHVSEEIQQVNDYVSGKNQPKSTNITIDPYFKTEESRTVRRLKERAKRKQRSKKSALSQ